MTEAFAKDYVLVGVSGFGTRRAENAWQPSGAHENLPYAGYKRFELVHYSKKSELQAVVDEFKCTYKKASRPNLGLIIMANSWGSGKAIKLSKMFEKQCDETADLFVMVDGFKKPFLPQGRKPVAKRCINYYQTKGLIRGKSIKGCNNNDLTKKLCPKGVGGIECHIKVEWSGTARGSKIIKTEFLR